MTMLGYELSEKTLKEIITEVDEDGKKNLASDKFLITKLKQNQLTDTIYIN